MQDPTVQLQHDITVVGSFFHARRHFFLLAWVGEVADMGIGSK